MLLPMVLLLATAGPTQQTATVVAAAQQSSTAQQERSTIDEPGADRFVNPGANSVRRKPLLDGGIVVPKDRCLDEGTCQTGCLSITAYVFSDGENPELKYVTHCPNLDVPNQTERARRKLPNGHQPDLKHTKN